MFKQVFIGSADSNGMVCLIKANDHLVGKRTFDVLDSFDIDNGASMDPPEVFGVKIIFKIFNGHFD